ncbi:hypothetical protein AGABI2DRAFT_225490, partial [Agaricus bisporus var. bisporus H97]|uniref:hypothetical protein n=1 Tax=Agaricus bisporus var. bisporus (strain H97 / ATCC MYA-4626 / FGSC 10389) TaxID=936046 RepID=UPI00029F7D29
MVPSSSSRPLSTQWFFGPATGSALLPRRMTSLEREINRDEQQIQMYGGDCIHEPPPKAPLTPSVSFDEQETEESGGQKPEEGLPAHSFLSPSATLDGNLVGWDGPDDPKNPQNWSFKYKCFITFCCILMALDGTFASSAPSLASPSIRAEFHSSREVADLITTTFLLGYVFGPLIWGPGSELIGRRPIFRYTLVLYTLSFLGQSLAKNMETLLVTRFISGFLAAVPVTNCGGVIADIWSAAGRGPAMSLFTASVFLGPVLGPVISGLIIQADASWRWIFWVMMFFTAAITLLVVPFFPETYAPVILLYKVKRLRKEDPVSNKNLYAEHENQDWSVKGVLNRTILRPFKMLAVEPILLLVTLYISVVYGLLYGLFQAFPIIFTQIHHFNIAETGLIFIGTGIGTTIGSLINYLLTLGYPKLIVKWRGFPPPEKRLLSGMIGAPALVIGALWMGWAGNYESVPWYVAGLGTIVLGMGISLIFMSFLSYLVDTYLMYSASAFAANTFLRSAVAAAFPLFTVQMFNALGVNWACTMLGLVGLVFLPTPFLFYKYGARLRAKSVFAPCIDLKIKKEIEEEER